MNSGLPSLLDAIFGKQNLDSVSLDEIYELINEFPSFNAGHFLLSKKLKEQNEGVYEKETMRTALYFNNPFWLESALTEGNHQIAEKINSATPTLAGDDFSASKSFDTDSETGMPQVDIEESEHEPNPPFADHSPSVQPDEFQQSLQDEQEVEKITEKQQFFQEEAGPEFSDRPVRSFDDLFSKYHIEPSTAEEKTFNDLQEKTTDTEKLAGELPLTDRADFSNEDKPTVSNEDKPTVSEPVGKSIDTKDADEFINDEITGDYEIREEVINDYGIFEEVKVKKTDFDIEAFDRPVTNTQDHAKKSEESASEIFTTSDAITDDTLLKDDSEVLHEKKEESPVAEVPEEEQPKSDYDAFDRPIDLQQQEESESVSDLIAEEESISEIYSGHEERFGSVDSRIGVEENGTPDISYQESESGHDQIPELAARFDEQRKIMSSFDPKKSESIVFAPYHMIDYFASQGIKLVIEENPIDPFAKQLKSFTDWLKVMKKLPAKAILEKTDEKDEDRVRHYAAHSIDEREILTESMAEVLAKQGMYENAIALYQKLSLIYPPKSAYFASRIEQLKASLP